MNIAQIENSLYVISEPTGLLHMILILKRIFHASTPT